MRLAVGAALSKTMKTQPAPLKEKTVYGRRLLIYRNTDTRTPTACNVWAILKTDNYDGKETQLYDWKADFEAKTIYVRGAVYWSGGQWEQFENTFPCEKEEVALVKPGRNFVWSEFDGVWRNPKTGERRRAY